MSQLETAAAPWPCCPPARASSEWQRSSGTDCDAGSCGLLPNEHRPPWGDIITRNSKFWHSIYLFTLTGVFFLPDKSLHFHLNLLWNGKKYWHLLAPATLLLNNNSFIIATINRTRTHGHRLSSARLLWQMKAMEIMSKSLVLENCNMNPNILSTTFYKQAVIKSWVFVPRHLITSAPSTEQPIKYIW